MSSHRLSPGLAHNLSFRVNDHHVIRVFPRSFRDGLFISVIFQGRVPFHLELSRSGNVLFRLFIIVTFLLSATLRDTFSPACSNIRIGGLLDPSFGPFVFHLFVDSFSFLTFLASVVSNVFTLLAQNIVLVLSSDCSVYRVLKSGHRILL